MSKLEALLESSNSAGAPISSLLLDAQHAYKDKQYEKALQCYTKAIEHGRDQNADFVHLYELRSAVYVKLKQDELALQDAKKMIRLDRKDARGYIRCAQIEQLSNNNSSAIQFYEHGLKNVPKIAPLHSQLEFRLNRTRQLAAKNVIFAKGTDPLQVLPPELLQMVLSYMSYRQIVNALRVSKLWKNTLSSGSELNDTIDFRESHSKLVRYPAVNAAVRRLGRKRKLVSLAYLNNSAARFMLEQFQKWINWTTLEHLRISDCNLCFNELRWEKYRLKTVELDFRPRAVTTIAIAKILDSCLDLQKATFLGVSGRLDLVKTPHNKSLEVLGVIFREDHGSYSIDFATEWPFPNLQELTIRNAFCFGTIDLSSCESLHKLDLRRTWTHRVAQLNGPPHLETLCVQEDVLSHAFVEPHPHTFNVSFNNVRNLSLTATAPREATFVALVVQRGLQVGKLKHLHLDQMPRGTPYTLLQCFYSIQSIFENLESLILKDDLLDDTTRHGFYVYFPKITSLDIEAPQITGAFIGQQLRYSQNKITSLVLRNCDKVGPDTADWARERGVDVRVIRNYSGYDGGRRVRYE